MILETISVGPMQANCYIIASGNDSQAIIIDPGDEKHKIDRVLEKYNLKPAFIINTHGHIDHIGCDDKFGVPVYVHRQDAALLKSAALNLSAFLGASFKVKSDINELEDKQSVKLGELELEVIHTPGHSPGGISLLMKKPKDNILFTGDSLFYHSIGRTDFPGASNALLVKSIKEKLLKLSDDTVIYPGHGPSSTIGEERINNSFLQLK
jgi:glyoxylase-like metal-dependent hydrolase (beta-lactamase superfamily II)